MMAPDPGWMVWARCRGHPPELFFPHDGLGVESAQRVCSTCPVRDACLNYAIDHHIDYGVWGGASEREGRRITRARRSI